MYRSVIETICTAGNSRGKPYMYILDRGFADGRRSRVARTQGAGNRITYTGRAGFLRATCVRRRLGAAYFARRIAREHNELWEMHGTRVSAAQEVSHVRARGISMDKFVGRLNRTVLFLRAPWTHGNGRVNGRRNQRPCEPFGRDLLTVRFRGRELAKGVGRMRLNAREMRITEHA